MKASVRPPCDPLRPNTVPPTSCARLLRSDAMVYIEAWQSPLLPSCQDRLCQRAVREYEYMSYDSTITSTPSVVCVCDFTVWLTAVKRQLNVGKRTPCSLGSIQ